MPRKNFLTLLIASAFFLVTNTLAYAETTKKPKAYVQVTKASATLSQFYFQNRYSVVHRLPSLSPDDRAIIYGCGTPDDLFANAIFICEKPLKQDIKLHAFVIPAPSPIMQLELARKTLDHQLKATVIYSSESELQYRYLLANKSDSVKVQGYRSVGPLVFDTVLQQLIIENDIVLALYDNKVFNESTYRALFINTYHARKPVFGPSLSFVSLGSLAGAYIDELSVAREAIKLSKEFNNYEYLPGIYFPSTVDVAVNRHVAEAFSLTVPKEDDLRAELLANHSEALKNGF